MVEYDYARCLSTICVLFLISVTEIHGVSFESVGGSLPVNNMQFSLVCSDESGSGVDFFKDVTNVGSCIPNTPAAGVTCVANPGYNSSTDGSTTHTIMINVITSSSCDTYKCKDFGNSQEASYQLTYNKFNTDNTSLSPEEPTQGTSGALNITTACLFPISDESITINWYKTYQDGKTDEALDSSVEIYNETQISTCTDTCGTESDAKMLIGCKNATRSTTGTGFRIKVEVTHKAYTDKLSYTFDGTYYVEDCKCDCCIYKIVWIVVSIIFSLPSLGGTSFVVKDSRRKKWLKDNLGKHAHRCMIGWVVLNLVYSIIAAILFFVLVCKNDCCEEECDCVCNCWPIYIIIGYVLKAGDVIVDIIGGIAFKEGTNKRNVDRKYSHEASNMEVSENAASL